MAKKNEQSPKDAAIGFIILVIIGLLMWGGCEMCSTDKEPENPIPKTQSEIFEENKAKEMADSALRIAEAYTMSKDFVLQGLKAPSTAEFASIMDAKIWSFPDSTYVIKSYVDAQNSFGAQIRSNYYARLKYLGNDKWMPLKVNIEE